MPPPSYLTYIKLSTAIRRNENMAKGLQRALLQQQPDDDSKRSPRPQDLIRLYDIILQVTREDWAHDVWGPGSCTGSVLCGPGVPGMLAHRACVPSCAQYSWSTSLE